MAVGHDCTLLYLYKLWPRTQYSNYVHVRTHSAELNLMNLSERQVVVRTLWQSKAKYRSGRQPHFQIPTTIVDGEWADAEAELS